MSDTKQETLRQFAKRVDNHIAGWTDRKYLALSRDVIEWVNAKEALFWHDEDGGDLDERVVLVKNVRDVGEDILSF